MMKQSLFVKNSIVIFFLMSVTLLSFQNCSKTKFSQARLASTAGNNTAAVNPICNAANRPLDTEYVACLSPYQSSIRATQNYTVICQANGTWTRTPNGSPNYALCGSTCDSSKRPSDTENIFCPSPNSTVKSGVQSYSVSCAADGSWSRSLRGAADYSACPVTCNSATRPSSTSPVACPAPYQALTSGIQNYTVTCSANGSWIRTLTGTVDYSSCPQSCDPSKRPATSEAALCPGGDAMDAKQNYTVTCSSNGSWIRTPSTFDTSLCKKQACDPVIVKEQVACPAPYQSILKSVQSFSQTCDGVKKPTTRDDSLCPKSCSGTAPANGTNQVACQSPFASQNLAKQSYTYSCDSTTGSYVKNTNPVIDYSACPKSCTGPVPPSRNTISCPAGTTGTAYQNYTYTCNTATGQYTQSDAGIDTSGCVTTPPKTCTGTKPSDFDSVACPAPFTDRFDAKRLYTVTCDNGSWFRSATGSVDTSACPVNDCSGSVNPGPTKYVGQCPGGASGSVTQTCSLSCTGKTYSQVNCSANDYSSCDCGASATFNPATKSCIPNVCTNGTTNYPSCNVCPTGKVFNGISCIDDIKKFCTPGKQQYAGAITNGYVNSTCNAEGSAFGQPYSAFCSSGFDFTTAQIDPTLLSLYGISGSCQPPKPACGPVTTQEQRNCLAANSSGKDTWQIVTNTCDNSKTETLLQSNCSCNAGYTWNGTICAADPVVPKTCDVGYKLENNKCVPVTCGPMNTVPSCHLTANCTNGGGGYFLPQVGIPSVFTGTGTYGQVVYASASNMTVADPSKYTLINEANPWGGLSFRCNAQGQWEQSSHGYCHAVMTIPDTDYSCQINTGG